MESQQIGQFLPPSMGFLFDVTRKVLPAIFLLLFVASGTGVLIVNMGFKKPIPSNYLIGVAIAFGVVTTLIAAGNLLLYVHKQNSHIRSTSNSASSIGCEGEPWYLIWKHYLVKYEIRQRAFVREYVLRNESEKNSKKRLAANVEQVNSHIDSNSFSNGMATPVDYNPLVERGRTHPEVEFPENPNLSGRSPIETTRAKSELELSGGDGVRKMISRDDGYHKHSSPDIQATSRVSAAIPTYRLPDSVSGTLEGPAARLEMTSSSVTQARLTKPLHPEDVLKKHALYCKAWKRPDATRIQHDIVDCRILPELLAEGSIPDIPKIPTTPSEIELLHLEIVQQEVERANPEASYVNQRKLDSHRIS